MAKKKFVIWSFFSSVKLTIALLVIIAFIFIISTIIPQQENSGEFARWIPSGLLSFLQAIQIFNLYHSVLYFFLMGLLCLNLIVCSLNRFPVVWKIFLTKPSPENAGVFKDLSPELMIRTKEDQKTASEIAAGAMKRRFRRVQRQDSTDTSYLYGDKGRISYFGIYVVHLSILILIAGAVVRSIFGIEGYVNIIEGETVSVIDLLDGKKTISLPFTIRCDRFTVEFYENGAPKIYRSDLTFIKNGKIAYQGALLVNHPISFEGFRFYQSGYGLAPEGKASLSLFKDGKKSQDVAVNSGDTFDLPGGEGKVHVLKVEENIEQMGQAVKLSVRSPKGETVFWVFRQIDKIKEMNPGIIRQVPLLNPGLFQPYVFTMNGIKEKYYTGLQVGRDPGVPLMAVAVVLMIAGLMLVFFSSHRQIWIRIDKEGEQTRISVAGRSNKNPVGMDREIKHLLVQIRGRLIPFLNQR